MEVLTEHDFAALAALSPAAMLVLDRTGHVHNANPAAQALLARLGMLAVKSGILVARRKGEDKEIRSTLATLSPDNPNAVICLRNREGIPIVVSDLHLLASGLVAWRITELEARQTPSAARLKIIIGLTPAEARVAIALLSGMGLSAIAREFGVEPETVRTQAKRIRSKTGAHTQSKLLGTLFATGSDLAVPAGSKGESV